MIRTLEAHVATPPNSTSTSDNPILPKTCRTLWPEIDSLPPTFAVQVAPDNSWYAASKSVVDYLIAVAILPFALLLIGFAYALVRLSSAGPGFYNQTRLGRGGKPYKILKLRTMTYNVEKISGGPAWSQKYDTRITPVGNLLRKTHLDELPQIFNVLMGDMSLVGPRPERPEMIELKKLNDEVPGYAHRLLVKPGVTGLSQIQLPADSDLLSVRRKVVYDLYYIENSSFWFDMRIIVATLMKAAGCGPTWLRRLFLLPRREVVGEVFLRHVTTPQAKVVTSLLPA